MKRSLTVIAAACALVAALVAVAGSQAAARGVGAHSPYVDGRYIATFADDAAASYDGYVKGFPATRPRPATS